MLQEQHLLQINHQGNKDKKSAKATCSSKDYTDRHLNFIKQDDRIWVATDSFGQRVAVVVIST